MIICVEQFLVNVKNVVIGIVLVIVRGVIMKREVFDKIKDSVISQKWIDKVNSDKTPTRACRNRCFYCVLWDIETCVPKDDYKNKK